MSKFGFFLPPLFNFLGVFVILVKIALLQFILYLYLYYNVKHKLFWFFVDSLKLLHISFWVITILHIIYISFIHIFSLIFASNPDSQTCSCLFVFLKPTIAQIFTPILTVNSIQLLYLFWPSNLDDLYLPSENKGFLISKHGLDLLQLPGSVLPQPVKVSDSSRVSTTSTSFSLEGCSI